jgi:hypothetical protein
MPQPPQWRVRGSPACSNGRTGVQPPVRIGLLADCVGPRNAQGAVLAGGSFFCSRAAPARKARVRATA